MAKRDLRPDEDGPVFYAKGYGAFVPDEHDKPMGHLIGEIQNIDDTYVGFIFSSRRIQQLGRARDSFDEALHAFFEHRAKNRRETERPRPVKIIERMARKKWHTCLLCGLHDPIVKSMKLADEAVFLCVACITELNNGPPDRLQALLHILKQRPKGIEMDSWMKKISERGGFELWYREKDSGVFVDSFTVVRGKDKWQLGTDGAAMIDTTPDREMREHFPVAYDWAVNQIARFLLQRQRQMLANPHEQEADK